MEELAKKVAVDLVLEKFWRFIREFQNARRFLVTSKAQISLGTELDSKLRIMAEESGRDDLKALAQKFDQRTEKTSLYRKDKILEYAFSDCSYSQHGPPRACL